MNGESVERERSAHEALALFHPVIRRWFQRTYPTPTEIQLRSWPVIAAGKHVLLTAPTGSGKTLCAFLWALNQLFTGVWPSRNTRVLYVSPLKALNNDIRRNLVHPLREIRERFDHEGIACPEIRILTRSGDTPPRERQQMLRLPPEILITTPESLNLLLSSPRARENLRSLETVILDEIHAIADGKRGTHLVTAVERLVLLSGEFQRIALSATVKPVERIAEWIGGYRLIREPGTTASRKGRKTRPDGDPIYKKRDVTILRSSGVTPESVHPAEGVPELSKRIELSVRSAGSIESKGTGVQKAGNVGERDVRTRESEPVPPHPEVPSQPISAREAFWSGLVREIKGRIHANRSTLIFTNTRRHAEKLARLINEQEDVQLAYAHHGSLSKEIRLVVEQKLKAGELSAIVATSSLELGIDIGALDEVLLVQTPFSVSSTLQRIGRAGHGVGEVSRGRLYCTHGRDLLNAALMARSIAEQDIEEIHPVEAPLDLLAQIILSMTAVQTWQVDELYEVLKTSSPYRDLPRRHYDLVLEMLAGRYADQYLREIKSRLSWDRIDNTLRAQRGALPLIYSSGGTIPDRGYYDLRLQNGVARIGELDEEFVWERKVGDTFNLGTQNWKIVRIDSKSVEVVPWNGAINITPFWKAEKAGRDFTFSEKVGLFLEAWNDRLGDQLGRSEYMANELMSEYYLDEASAYALIDFLKAQRTATGADLPHRHHLLIEHVEGVLAGASFSRVILHTLWGNRVNYPFSLILSAAWNKRRVGGSIEVMADDDCVLIIPSDPENFSVDKLLSLAQPRDVETLLRNSLEGSGFFAARFRENAGRALLLPRSNLNRRIPLWLTRMRAKKLLEGVASYGEFPILLETWRSCLQDEFDLPSLKAVLAELQQGRTRCSEVRTSFPSPLAENISWIQTNEHVYRGDGAVMGSGSAVKEEVIREILYSSRLRPRIDPMVATDLQSKLQRTAAGYAPDPAEELLDWIKERLLVPDKEWRELIEAIRRDHGPHLRSEELVTAATAEKLVSFRFPGADTWMVSALEQMPRILGSMAAAKGMKTDELRDLLEVDDTTFSLASPSSLRSILDSQDPGQAAAELHFSALVAEWLRYYGPVPLTWVGSCFGLTSSAVAAVLDTLSENGTVVVDQLTREASEPQVCDAENLEILLRLTRKGRRPSFTALNPDRLPLFLAVQQGLISAERKPRNSGLADLRRIMESLFGFPAAFRMWEEEIFPARLKPYYVFWLDELLRASELQWFGCDRRRVAFCFGSDLELFLEPEGLSGEEGRERLLPSSRGRFSFWELVDYAGSTPAETTRKIWDLVWKGELAADSFEVLRKAAAAGFRAPLDRSEAGGIPKRAGRRRARGGSYDRWRAAHPLSGNWFGINRGAAADPLEEEELNRDRIRQLLSRYGIIFRELVTHELAPLQWSRIFRTLRIMELSGEILSGYFFEGITGLQFVSHRGLRFLQAGLPEDEIYWINAADPASPCGLGLPIAGLPARLVSNHLVFHGSRLALLSKRRGSEVEVRVSPDDSSLPRYLQVFSDCLNRDAAPRKTIRVERINGTAARESPYKEAFVKFGFVEEYRGLIMRAGY